MGCRMPEIITPFCGGGSMYQKEGSTYRVPLEKVRNVVPQAKSNDDCDTVPY